MEILTTVLVGIVALYLGYMLGIESGMRKVMKLIEMATTTKVTKTKKKK